ncbi:ABC transporter ATP-binding protein [Enterococcus asini]|uniref:ABC transporter ATP-binding protein n=1 Tax=Enterococcus asini TaxID=57732 RepID=UPI00288E1132|nr:ABC transporter ATP-binding protein [Enterococcus asini]MDT2756138.1 ABC transporter ATP-binding protein [Enterococcus asini]
MAILEIQNLVKNYFGEVTVEVLKGINLKVEKGEFVAIMGPSGSGKTTLLNCVATLDTPTSGSILIDGAAPQSFNPNQLADFRRQNLGFVFQNYNLLAPLTVIENIVLPLTLEKESPAVMLPAAENLMKELDILDLKDKRIYQLSGGEAQRVAICRALIHEPSLILADEPTGNLDSKAANSVMELLSQLNSERQVTTLMVTHDAFSASFCNRVVFIKDGRFYNELYLGDDRDEFYQKILTVLSHLGGRSHELLQADY